MNKMKSGIYMWTSPSGKKYIGQSTDLVKRYNQFLNFNHRYGGKKINDARTKYHTIDEWSYKVLERCGYCKPNRKLTTSPCTGRRYR